MPIVFALLCLPTLAKGELVSLPFCRGEEIFTNRKQEDGSIAFCVQSGLKGNPRVLVTSREVPASAKQPLDDFCVSEDGRLLAYFDTQADARYEAIRLLDVESGKKLDDAIYWTHSGDFGWLNGGFYYGGYRQPATPSAGYGAERVLYHKLGSPQEQDSVVYQDPEHPHRKYLFLTTNDRRFLMLHVLDRVNGQVLDAEWFRRESRLDGQFTPILDPPAPGRTYLCDNVGDTLIVQTTYKAPEGRIVAIDTRHPDEAHWKTLIEGPVEDGNMIWGRLAVTKTLSDGGSKAILYSMKGRKVGELPSEPGSKVDVQYGRPSDPYAFMSLESNGTKRYFWLDRSLKKLHAMN